MFNIFMSFVHTCTCALQNRILVISEYKNNIYKKAKKEKICTIYQLKIFSYNIYPPRKIVVEELYSGNLNVARADLLYRLDVNQFLFHCNR